MGHGKAGTWGTVRQLKSGRYQVSFMLDGVRLVSPDGTYTSKLDAQAWLAGERRKIELDEWLPFDERADRAAKPAAPTPKRLPTLRTYAADWMERTPHRPGTAAQYERHLRLRILPALGGKRLDEITRPVVIGWWRLMIRGGQNRACDQTFALLRTIMAAAVDDELIPVQPCRVKGAGRASKVRNRAPLTAGQVQAVADAMVRPQWRIGVLLAAWCGLRSGEVRELRRKNVVINPDGTGVLQVRQAVSRAGRQMVIGDPKTDAGVRDIPVPGSLVPVLEAHLQEFAGRFPDSLLIAQDDGSTVTESMWRKAFRGACRVGLAPPELVAEAQAKSAAAGRLVLPVFDPGLTFHDLRRTALTSMASAGATIKELQQVAGHAAAAVAVRYQQVAQSHLDEVMGRVSAMVQAG